MSASKPTGEQRTVYFAGQVQGVGFRYTTRQIAGGHRVTGYVQNLDDGRVLVVAEGEVAELNRFFDELRSTMRHYVRTEQSTVQESTGQFAGFVVKQ